jgi:hypothetical protein
MPNNPALTKAEVKLLLRLRQLRKADPCEVKVSTYPLQINVRGVWEVLEAITSGSAGGISLAVS